MSNLEHNSRATDIKQSLYRRLPVLLVTFFFCVSSFYIKRDFKFCISFVFRAGDIKSRSYKVGIWVGYIGGITVEFLSFFMFFRSYKEVEA